MAALLASTPATYVDPKAAVLYGGGNSKISDDDIRAYINSGASDADVMAKAVENGVSASQISNAMGSNPAYSTSNVDKYITSQGVSKEQTPVQYSIPDAASTPAPVTFKPITVGSTETVQGQLDGMLSDTNSPMNVRASTLGNQYSNKRGLLDSSIGAEAGVAALIDRSMPIASQDASTNFAAKQQNAQGALTADTFNADVTSRTNMFNTGAAKDIYTANMSNQNNIDLANIDTKNKLAIANVQAMANDSGIMGDLGKTYMSLYQQVASDPNMTPEVKTATINNLSTQLQGLLGLLPSINSSAKALTFGTASNNEGDSVDNASTIGTNDTAGIPPEATKANVLGYKVEPSVMSNVLAYEKATGTKIDPAKVAPEQLVMDIKNLGQSPSTYLSSDGTNKVTNTNAYDINALFKQYNVTNVGELFNAMFMPAHPPGTMRADNPMFYVYK